MLSSWRATVTHGEQPDLHDISIHALLAESDAKQKIRYSSDETFLSTLSLRRATPRICFRCSSVSISIHAPDRPAGLRTIDFYPRSPCGERLGDSGTSRAGETFLSTLSLRRATGKGTTTCHMCDDFFPRSPCGERLHNIGHPVSGCLFLSTLSLRRATGGFLARAPGRSEFLSTLSLRRATLGLQLPPPSQEDFYPRSPCGERPSS